MIVDVLLKPTGDAPIMKKRKWTVERTKKISSVIDFVRKYLKFEPQESLVSSNSYYVAFATREAEYCVNPLMHKVAKMVT